MMEKLRTPPVRTQIYFIDDDPSIIEIMKIIFYDAGITNVKYFTDPEELLNALNSNVHICIVDYNLKADINGLELMKKIVEKNPYCWFVMLSSQTDVSVVVEFLNSVNGSRYIEKGGDMHKTLVHYVKDILSYINFVDQYYFNAERIEQGIADLKEILKDDKRND